MIRGLRQLLQIAIQRIKNLLNQEKENQRKANMAVCANVISKYDQITSARTKEKVFKQWMQKL